MLAADGTFTRCGGRVVKNVTGYDLAKLYVGSLGSLGVITSAWLRLLPLPEATEFLRLSVPRSEAGFEKAVAAARHTSARVAALIAPELAVSGACADDSVELSGDAAAVLRDGDELRNGYAAEEADAESVAAVREHQFAEGIEDSPVSLFARVRVLPTKLWSAWNRLVEHGALCFAYPARGDLFARIELRASTSIASVFEALEESAALAGGSYAVESAPLSVKREYDVFGQDPELATLTASMKRAFDPKGVLNAGRFAGRQ
jgi:glycolate oxidase FAD binding subunit